MKVTFLGHTIPESGVTGVSNGISRYTYNLAKEIRSKGNDLDLLVRNDFKPKEKWIQTINSPKFGWFPYPLSAYFRVKNIQSDIFHADYVNTGAPLIWAKKSPTVVTIHDVLPFNYNPKDLTAMDRIRVKWYMKNFKSIENADAIILASEHAKQEALKCTNIPEEKLHAIHYGIDLNKFKPKKRKSSDVVKIGYLGGLDGRKNVGVVVDAFKQIVKDYDNVELHLGGTGRNFSKFKSMNVPRMELHGSIPLNKAPDFLNSLDAFVFPTLGEGFGLPVCEAMACGVPVIASNVTTMPELVKDAGILTNPTVKGLVKSMSKMIENKNLRKKLGKRGYDRMKKFTWDNAAKKTIDVYEEVM